MAWTRIDDNFFDNQKVRDAGKEAAMLYISGLIYASNQLSDGFISNEAVKLVAFKAWVKSPNRFVEKLVEVGLWEKAEGGFQIHDYLEYNMSKADIQRLNEAKAKAGRKGGKASAQARVQANDQAIAQAPACDLLDAEVQADAQAKPKQNSSKAQAISHTHTHTHTQLNNLNNASCIPPTKKQAEDQQDEKPEIGSSGLSEIFELYSQIQMLNSYSRDLIIAAVEDYSADWVKFALEETIRQGKHNWSYAEAILKRWKEQGFMGRSVPEAKKPATKIMRDADGVPHVLEVI